MGNKPFRISDEYDEADSIENYLYTDESIRESEEKFFGKVGRRKKRKKKSHHY